MNTASPYTDIDASTAAALRKIAVDAGIDPNADRSEIADAVAKYIHSSARYTLYPYVIPASEDFTLHFLQTSKRGYCIHFATAATLMLRALDVPARFTSGFIVDVRDEFAGKNVVVTDRNAHAWVEVYYPHIGWAPLEVTPTSPGTGTGGSGAAQHTVPDLPNLRPGASLDDPFDDMFPDDLFDLERPTTTPSPPRVTPDTDDSGQGGAWGIPRPVAYFLVCVFVFTLAFTTRWHLARFFRKRTLSQEDKNAAAIYVWRYVTRLDRNIKHPENIEAIALKARFSQHQISEDERDVMVKYADTFCTVTYKRKTLSGKALLFIRGL